MEHPISDKIMAVTIATNDPEFLSGFYQQAFNLPAMKWEGKDHVGVQLNNLYLGFDRVKEKVKDTAGGPVIWFYVENVEETFLHFVEAGARVRTNVNRDYRPGLAIAVFYDPDGNMFGIMGPSVPGGKV